MVDQDALKSIEDLHRLKTEGVITEADFDKAKERLLFGAPSNRSAVPASRPTPMSAATVAPYAFPGLDPNLAEHLGWITLPLKRYADFSGRSGRKEFWMFQLLFVALGVVGFAALGSARDYEGNLSGFGLLMFASVMIATLGLVVPLLAAEARRFHDQDKSGWFVLLNLVPYLGGIIVLVLMLMEGTPGDNQYGPNPRQAGHKDHPAAD